MQVIRCPECGNRLDSGYCPMCMKRVPFPAQTRETPWQQRKYTSSRRDEDHECISFEQPVKRTEKQTRASTVFSTLGNAAQQRRKAQNNKKQATTVAVVVAVLSLLSSLFSMFDSVSEGTAEPEINYDAYVLAGDAGAEEVPAVSTGEIYNANGIVVTVDSSGLYYDDYALSITVINESDRDVTVSTDLLSVNSYMMPSVSLFAEAKQGESVQSYLFLESYDLEEVGIEQVASVEFNLDIYDSDDYTTIDRTDLITVTTDVDGYAQPVDDRGMELYNDGGVRIILKETELGTYGDYTVSLFLENTSGRMATIGTHKLLINGQETSGLLWTTLRPNTRTVDGIYFYDMEELGIEDITQIKEVSIDLHIEYMEDWYVGETVNTTLVFSPAELEQESE